MSDEPLLALIQAHLARYPASGLLDVYKLLHQATFGPGHAITNRKITREWLEYEFSIAGTPSDDEPLLERIHPAGAIVRVHVRPYLAFSADVKPFLNAFVRSGKAVQGDPAEMAQRWAAFAAFCQGDASCSERFSPREMRIFGQVRADEKWPAVHHSPAYVEAYKPRYRVLTRAEAETLCGRINAPFEVV